MYGKINTVLRLKSFIRLLRVHQWTKSGFIFLPFIFSDNLNNFISAPLGPSALGDLSRLLLAFFGFSIMAGAGYIINDIKDIRLDRMDPVKKNRPLASGAVNPKTALVIALILLPLGPLSAFMLSPRAGYIFILYFLFNQLFYSYLGKQVILLDVFIIAIGFILRVLVGALVLEIDASPWLLSCTFFLALFLGFSKRFTEIRGVGVERLLGGSYNLPMLQSFTGISAALAIVNYSIYCILGRHAGANLIMTVPLVVLGIFRYYVVTHDQERTDGGNPSDVLLSDKFMILIIFSWLMLCAVLILHYDF